MSNPPYITVTANYNAQQPKTQYQLRKQGPLNYLINLGETMCTQIHHSKCTNQEELGQARCLS